MTETTDTVQESKIQPKGYIILDTNILIKFGQDPNKKKVFIREAIFEHLQMLLTDNPGYYLSISAITKYELIKKSTIHLEVEREKLLKGVKCFNITMPVIRLTGRLSCFYEQFKISEEQIELPDKIIAATSMITTSAICTTNPSDYPAPFFAELTNYRKVIEHPGKSGFPIFVVLYILVPQRNIVGSLWKERVAPIKKKKHSKK